MAKLIGFLASDRSCYITGKDGTHVRMDATSYFQGAAFRVNPDGTGLQVLAQNFRNPYELALDSFGTIFQTDNDQKAIDRYRNGMNGVGTLNQIRHM